MDSFWTNALIVFFLLMLALKIWLWMVRRAVRRIKWLQMFDYLLK